MARGNSKNGTIHPSESSESDSEYEQPDKEPVGQNEDEESDTNSPNKGKGGRDKRGRAGGRSSSGGGSSASAKKHKGQSQAEKDAATARAYLPNYANLFLDDVLTLVAQDKACLWPLLASGKGTALTARQQGENVLKYFLYWNKFHGNITIAPTPKFLDHKVVWKITKKHGGDGKHREDSAVKWKVALEQGYHAWCKFVVTKLKHVYIQGLDWINTTKTVQWPNVLTLDGVGVLIEAFPLPVRQEDLEQHDNDDMRSFPTQKVFEANAKKLYKQAKSHHQFLSLLLVSDSATECNTETNLRVHPELWARMALITLFCCSGSDACVQKRMDALLKKKKTFGTYTPQFQNILMFSFALLCDRQIFLILRGRLLPSHASVHLQRHVPEVQPQVRWSCITM